MNDIVDEALDIKADTVAGTHLPADDDVFVLHRTDARLMELDNSIGGTTQQPRKLLEDDGDIETQIVQSVRTCAPENKDGRRCILRKQHRGEGQLVQQAELGYSLPSAGSRCTAIRARAGVRPFSPRRRPSGRICCMTRSVRR